MKKHRKACAYLSEQSWLARGWSAVASMQLQGHSCMERSFYIRVSKGTPCMEKLMHNGEKRGTHGSGVNEADNDLLLL